MLVVLAALTACSETTDAAGGDAVRVPTPIYSGEVPSFDGPWAAEFERAYRSTNSELVHTILRKGSITDQDYASVSAGYEKCMGNKGFRARVTGPAGEAVVDGTGDASLAAEKACGDDLAVIAGLRHLILRNPQRLDENAIVAACLVKKKLAPATYTAKDYAADVENQRFPYDIDGAAFSACTSDPLGLSWDK